MSSPTPSKPPIALALVGIGLIGGAFAGLFGVGGGLLMVPLLLWWAKMNHKQAWATSLIAITPAALVGAWAYGIGGFFEWETALYVALGSIVGAQLGAWLLRRVNVTILRWFFIAFVVFSAVSLVLEYPEREGTLSISLGTAVLLVALGLAMGVTAGLFGIGGGVIVVPVLILFFGNSDLVAKGVSLLAMAPGSISGSISHLRHHSASLRDGLWVALGAVITTPLGALLAFALAPRDSALLFSVLLWAVAANLVIQALRKSSTA